MSLIFKLKTKLGIVSTHHVFRIDIFNKMIFKNTTHTKKLKIKKN